MKDEYLDILSQIHASSIDAIENCKKIFIWGLSLNDYDAELMILLRAARKNAHEKKLWIINPDKGAADRAKWITLIPNGININPT